ncbi:hypothetical protein M9458_019140, partial [Cirrhinus mrigala]
PSINWARSAASHGGAGIKPTGIADVYSKFRPVKRVSPLKHQPEESEPEAEGKSGERSAEAGKEDACAVKSKGLPPNGALFGELEHYDLDMDEILDVPYIKSSQQTATLPRDKRSAGAKGATLTHSESLSGGTQFCVLSPVNWPDIRKSKAQSAHAAEPDALLSGLDKADGGPSAPEAGQALESVRRSRRRSQEDAKHPEHRERRTDLTA